MQDVQGDVSPLKITTLAAEKVRGILEAENDQELGLRVFVTGGGCQGLSYGMALDNNVADDDVTFVEGGVKLIADRETMEHVKGSEIDYVDQLVGGGFTLNNPNAVSTCACGSSFKTEEEAGNPGSCGC